jgi:capsular polysaccharide transport system ATP-binding protein
MITLQRVGKAYPTATGRKVVLDDATATFDAGCNVGILGANGVGKSTLIRLLAGSEMPDRGTIRRDVRVSFPLGFGGTFHGAPVRPRKRRLYCARLRRCAEADAALRRGVCRAR